MHLLLELSLQGQSVRIMEKKCQLVEFVDAGSIDLSIWLKKASRQ